eukprot:TRINITY_DN1123_c0_g1_i1.p1 TRINITY_DN1123_c0_g1~~TRINITY_DN1123_c0_g1_i1.p1  ORF type:complete len:114 (-),score=7.90 TRINITY_DN1123_c0_g1_i1:16-357(-)
MFTFLKNNFIFLIGFIILLHSGLSIILYRQQLGDQPIDFVPADIQIESFISVIICTFGLVFFNGNSEFKKIQIKNTYDKENFDMINSRLDFMIFNHRGKYFRKIPKKENNVKN